MKYLLYLSWIFFLSEFLLMLVKRSGASSSKVQKDKGSLILLWITITICFTLGFIFANWRVWGFNEYVIYGFGIAIVLLGFIIRWASILQLNKAFTVDVAIGNEHKLKTDGIYSAIRHPSYFGLLMIMLGFSISMNSLVSVTVVLFPMFMVLHYRIVVEEKLLIDEFGKEYTAYHARTKRLIPWVY